MDGTRHIPGRNISQCLSVTHWNICPDFSLKLKKFNTISKCNMATNFNTFLETYYLENLKSQKFEIENASLQYFLEIHRKKQYWVMPNVI
jgi:hypothetical protein